MIGLYSNSICQTVTTHDYDDLVAKYLKLWVVIALGIYISKFHKNYSENIIQLTEKWEDVREVWKVEKIKFSKCKQA